MALWLLVVVVDVYPQLQEVMVESVEQEQELQVLEQQDKVVVDNIIIQVVVEVVHLTVLLILQEDQVLNPTEELVVVDQVQCHHCIQEVIVDQQVRLINNGALKEQPLLVVVEVEVENLQRQERQLMMVVVEMVVQV